MKKITLLLLAAIPLSLFSQSKLIPGFIVKKNQDTIKGYLQQVPEKKIVDKISFAPTASAPASVFTTKDLASFGYDGGNIYQHVKYNNPIDLSYTERFAKKLVEGYYRLYLFWKDDKKFFVVNSYQDSTYLLYEDNMTPYGVVNDKGNYQDRLLFFSINCDTLKNSVESLSYSQTDLSKFVNRLNNCVMPSEQNEIVYKKDKSNFNVYLYAGGIKLGDKHEFTGRLIGRITLPALDPNMSVNVGLNYMSTRKLYDVKASNNTKIETRTVYGIPFTIQYNFISGRIRPYLDAGLSIDYIETKNDPLPTVIKAEETKFGLGFIIAAGIEGFVTKRLMIKVDWRYELFTHYPTIGIGYFIK